MTWHVGVKGDNDIIMTENNMFIYKTFVCKILLRKYQKTGEI